AGIYDIKDSQVDLAKSLGVHAYESLEALLDDKEINLVLVSTPNDVHKPIAIQAMRAGKNVVSEKPVTLSSEDLQEMIAVSKETGKLFTVHQNRRWDEDFLTMKQIYDSRTLGEVFRIESRVHG
ncbi:MAG TPA: gfo/Idh/MocA family oxidoreductase, partial [Lachnospiraceae bacterium]|nr:gfo/Idh/MocA family oxidoreductase [Lachnospiraceae bacterium]